MFRKINSFLLIAVSVVSLGTVGCKKGTFDINENNPNVPSTVDPKFVLSAAMTSSAVQVAGNPGGGSQSGNDLFNLYMGYWAVSGDYIPSAALLQYNLTTDFGSSIWDGTYPILKNYKSIIDYYNGDAKGNKFVGIAKIMSSLHYQRLVDIYNNIPYTEALNAGANNFPKYDDAKTIYEGLVDTLDNAINLINTAPGDAAEPGVYDIMYYGNMDMWIAFANTLKLKILMHLTETQGGADLIKSKLASMSVSDFLQERQDASINPGYANDANNHQNPLWQDIGSNTTGTAYGNNSYFRACKFAVDFYSSTNDPRNPLFFSTNDAGNIVGREFGSTALEHNSDISGIGGPSKGKTPSTVGLLKSPQDNAYILTAAESFFLQAEAVERGYIGGASAADLYKKAVTESFRLLGVAGYTAAATTYVNQSNDATNFANSSNKMKTLITQKWAALNTYDPLEAWSDWRRLGYPENLPVSTYPGTSAPHIPYRLLYPTSEYSYNSSNVMAQGTIDAITSKIFWMP